MAEFKGKLRYDDNGKNLSLEHESLTYQKLQSSNYYLSIINKTELRNYWRFSEREDSIKKKLGL
ncbi:MAG: hypothetical protein FI729_01515 [SAR202 cluster bacterium]|nr:hypothetical protein [SAR202 cluster bacterium]